MEEEALQLYKFHYFILETANIQKCKVFFFSYISLGNVNASGFVSCQYPQIY